MAKKRKGFKTSPYFWSLVLVPVALGLYDFIHRLNFRLHPDLPPEASEWYVRSWLVAGVAALVFAAVIAWVDRCEREPWKWLLLALIWGAVVAPAISHQLTVVAGGSLRGDIRGALDTVDNVQLCPEQRESVVKEVARAVGRNRITPIIEELCKGLFVFLIFLGVPHEFDDLLDGIVYGAMVGVGFAMVEQVWYLQGEVIENASKEAFWREFYERILLTGLWSHPMLTAFTGAGLGWARVAKSRWQRWTAPLLGFGLAAFIHTNWNSLRGIIGERTQSFEYAALVLIGPFAILMAVLVLFAWRRERKVLEHLAEVSTEFASKEVMRSRWARWRAQWKAWRRGGFRLWQKVHQLQRTLMEWAFLRWHMREGHVIDKEGAVAVWERYSSKVEDLVKQVAERELAA